MTDTMRVSIRIHDADARAALARAPGVFVSRLAAWLTRGANELAREARGLAPKAFSTLTNSISVTREDELHWIIAPGVAYGAFVEGGRRPGGMPGMSNGLREWIRLKLRPSSDKETDRLSFVIARAIGRKGIKPQPFMKPAFERKSDRVVELANAGVRQAVAEINRGHF